MTVAMVIKISFAEDSQAVQLALATPTDTIDCTSEVFMFIL